MYARELLSAAKNSQQINKEIDEVKIEGKSTQ